jgi:glycosyltransferase involved in cell wall biosynthesis
MRFLFLNQFFPPDFAPTGQLLGDVVAEIAERGHLATVIAARAAYAGVSGDAGERAAAGIRILRTRCLPFGHGRAARLLSYASFYAGALWRSFGCECDAVVTMTTPPLLSLAGTLLKKLRGVRHYIWEMDLYPEVAVALGVLDGRSVLTRVLARLANYSRRNADGVIVLGPCMRDRVIVTGVPAARVHIAENWADGAAVRPRPFPPADRLVVMYSGNLGLAHETATIAAAMEALGEDDRFHFVFAGGGARRAELEEFCRLRAMTNVTWRSYEAWDSLGAHLSACHIGLVTQTPASLGTLVPGKIYALMAAGRPLLYIGPRAATAARIVERFQCGWQIDAGDAEGLVALLRRLAAEPWRIAEAGARARAAFVTNYDLPAAVSTVLGAMGLAPARRPPASVRPAEAAALRLA